METVEQLSARLVLAGRTQVRLAEQLAVLEVTGPLAWESPVVRQALGVLAAEVEDLLEILCQVAPRAGLSVAVGQVSVLRSQEAANDPEHGCPLESSEFPCREPDADLD